ncbi:MAG: thiol reductant ABC exporter subunit CydD [Gammaproteobacteria bacterium]
MRILDFLKSQKIHTENYLTFSIGLGLSSGLLLIVQAWFLAKIITVVIFGQSTLDDVKHFLVYMLIVFILRALLNWGSEVSAFRAATKVKRELRNQLHKKLFYLGPNDISDQHSGEIINTMVDAVEALENYYARYLPTMALVALIPLSILVFVFPIDWISAVVLLVTAPLIPFFMILIGKGTERLNKKQWQKLARMSAHFLDMIQGMTTLKIFNASRREAAAISRVSEDYRKTTMSVLRVAFLSSLVLEFLASVSIAIVAVLIGFRLLYGEIDFFFGFFALLLAPEFYLPLRNMGTHYHARLEAIGAAEKIIELLEKPVKEQSNDQGSSFLENEHIINITFDQVYYSYAKREAALQNICFDIPSGNFIALIGESGAGKSTIIKLLAGFIQTQKGQIKINNVPLDKIDINTWRKKISWVPQNPHIFNGTIRENISLGMVDASDDQIKAAAHLANIHDHIESLPDQYDAIIHERGQGLSGGQIQRLALARAFLKDSPIILLDEATANLDEESERLIQQSLGQLRKNKTVIMIAHRLTTVEKADQIIVMKQGEIVESGTHQSLLNKSGEYCNFIKQLSKK